ncbi:MAG: hypothetical protein ACKVOT_14230 [Polaromonas sp.]
MGNAITSDVRALWLFLRSDGGWWTVSMLTHHWRPTFALFEVQAAIDALEAGGFIDSKPQLNSRSYCFTSDCKSLPELPPIASNTTPGDQL